MKSVLVRNRSGGFGFVGPCQITIPKRNLMIWVKGHLTLPAEKVGDGQPGTILMRIPAVGIESLIVPAEDVVDIPSVAVHSISENGSSVVGMVGAVNVRLPAEALFKGDVGYVLPLSAVQEANAVGRRLIASPLFQGWIEVADTEVEEAPEPES